MIPRDYYINKLKASMWNGTIKVITGLRRCGKSILLFNLFKNCLIDNGISIEDIIEIRLDDEANYVYRNPIKLSKYLNDLLNKKSSKKIYVFIDEVQLSRPKTDRMSGVKLSIFDVLNGLNNKNNIDIYVTGSNSKMLSKDILTEFRGRTTQIRVHPFSFKEFYDYKGGDINKRLQEYLVFGGMPMVVLQDNDLQKKEYLDNLFKETYLKDIVERNRVQRQDVLDDLLNYLASQISSLTNINSVANAISSKNHEKINHEMIANYFSYVEDSFVISEAKRFDVKGKQYFDYPSKFYFEDVGLRNAKISFRQLDSGHLMENIIYNELVRLGYSVDVGAVEIRKSQESTTKEIDFVVNHFDQKVYIQSAYSIHDELKKESEISPFRAIRDSFKKVVIRNDIASSYYDNEGIFNCNLVEFLLGKVSLL